MQINNQRLHSLDALRGFDMFFIVGGAILIKALCGLFPDSIVAMAIAEQMTHRVWDGFTLYDMIFPLFLFIAGVSFPYSLAAKQTKGVRRSEIVISILKRGAILVLLGLIFNNVQALNPEKVRYVSVLGRIGIAWAMGALIYLIFSWQGSIVATLTILMSYYLLNALVIAPDAMAGISGFTLEGSFVAWFDRAYLPGVLYEPTHDPQGILSTIPAIATALLGMIAGAYLKLSAHQPQRKAAMMATASVVMISLGLLFDLICPINKQLWSSSYVIYAGGLSLLLLSTFYWIIDVHGKVRWAHFFMLYGMNSIAVYMAQKILNFKAITNFFCGGFPDLLPDHWGPVLFGVVYIAVSGWVVWFLFKHKILIKV